MNDFATVRYLTGYLPYLTLSPSQGQLAVYVAGRGRPILYPLWFYEEFGRPPMDPAHLRGREFSETSGTHLHKRGYRKLHEDTSIDVDIYDTVLGPYRVEELLPHSAPKPLGDVSVRTLEPTELLALKVVAAKDRRGSEKGSKDLADLLALLSSEGRSIAWDRIEERVPRKDLKDILRTALSDYRTTSRLYPLPMREYKALKRRLDRFGLI